MGIGRMIDDIQIIEAARHAERITAVVPNLPVTKDAVFLAIILGKRKPGRPPVRLKAPFSSEPPEWFTEAASALKGRTLTIGEFMLLAGRLPYTRLEAVAIGRWLRGSGRKPIKRGGKQVFAI